MVDMSVGPVSKQDKVEQHVMHRTGRVTWLGVVGSEAPIL